MSFVCQSYVPVCMSLVYHSYVRRMFRMSSVCHSYVPVCRPYVTCMYSYIIRMSLVCLVCHLYITRMYYYVTRLSLVCTRMYVIPMSLVCTRLLFVCHSYVLVCHLYVTRMWFYYEPFKAGIINADLSDHFLIVLAFKSKGNNSSNETQVKYIYKGVINENSVENSDLAYMKYLGTILKVLKTWMMHKIASLKQSQYYTTNHLKKIRTLDYKGCDKIFET